VARTSAAAEDLLRQIPNPRMRGVENGMICTIDISHSGDHSHRQGSTAVLDIYDSPPYRASILMDFKATSNTKRKYYSPPYPLDENVACNSSLNIPLLLQIGANWVPCHLSRCSS
jgi:hypothetical protein